MQKKVVVITGASSGIGKALAFKFANEGWNIVIAARRYERLKEIESQITGVEVLSVKTDITVESECKNLIDLTIAKFGKIDVMLNNAGISMRALFTDLNLEVMHKMMDVNYWGTVYCSKYALPWLLQTKGSLVGVISVGGYVGLPGRTGYSAAKYATRGFLETLRTENLKTGLHVLIAAPGFTESEIRMNALTADGSLQGQTPRDEKKMMSSEACAIHIFNAVIKRKRKIILTFVEGKAAVFVSKMWQWLAEKVIYHMFAKEPDSPLK